MGDEWLLGPNALSGIGDYLGTVVPSDAGLYVRSVGLPWSIIWAAKPGLRRLRSVAPRAASRPNRPDSDCTNCHYTIGRVLIEGTEGHLEAANTGGESPAQAYSKTGF